MNTDTDSELNALNTLKNKWIMWGAIYYIAIIAFVASMGFMFWKSIAITKSGEPLTSFILGNVNTFASCAILLVLSCFFKRLKTQTRSVLDRKANTMVEEEELKFKKYKRRAKN